VKILEIDALFFRLPDDFQGGLSDALRLLADYHESVRDVPRLPVPQTLRDLDKPYGEWRFDLFRCFSHAVRDEGLRVTGAASLFDSASGESTDL
jgi:hypothetical protein